MKKTFSTSRLKLAGYLAWPLLLVVFFCWAALQGSGKSKLPVELQAVLAGFILIAFTVPQFMLCFQYWKKSKSVIFSAAAQTFTYTSPETAIEFTMNDISHIKKVCTYSKIYGNYSYFILTAKNQQLLFTCMLISSKAFTKIFGNATETKMVGWPSV